MVNYPMPDHAPPPFRTIQPFCEDVSDWLSSGPLTVAVVHCKAGKGRTGTMISCYLLYSRSVETADAAMALFGKQRTRDGRGVTIPSQIRYVRYMERFLRHPSLNYKATKVRLKRIVVEFVGGADELDDAAQVAFTVECPSLQTAITTTYHAEASRVNRGVFAFEPDNEIWLSEDVKVSASSKRRVFQGGSASRMSFRAQVIDFHCWFNTFFLDFISTEVSPAAQELSYVP